MFRKQITAGLNFSLTGMPHWNSDLGGFFAGSYNTSWGDNSATRNPMYQELYVRWLQFGVFCPMMRSHGADVPREFYWYGKKVNLFMTPWLMLSNYDTLCCLTSIPLPGM